MLLDLGGPWDPFVNLEELLDPFSEHILKRLSKYKGLPRRPFILKPGY